MPNYWLLKTEPGTYAYSDLEQEGKTRWDGVTNNLALKHIRNMNPGDLAFIYHTGDEKAIIGIAEIISKPYPDPKHKDSKLVVVDLAPKQRLKRQVPLEEIKKLKEFARFDLVRLPRLSVMPVTEPEWKRLTELGS